MSQSPQSLPGQRRGVLVLVVGPSGAGKDALMNAARVATRDDAAVLFARRIITRAAMPGAEDHDTLSDADFAATEAAGGFVLSWRAHGLAYGIPASIRTALDAGNLVIANTSRGVIAAAEALGAPVAVLNVTAAPEILAERIAKRGRETAADIAARLKREAPITARTATVIDVLNDGTLEEGAARFLAALAEARALSR
jgi:phosphonate metabolism protein PhnN/1,5-bisphosphokinase (PRPP-forming)